MENVTNFFETNLNVTLLFVIILGGIFLVKYTKEYTKLKDVYKVFIASVIFSIIFYIIDDCNGGCAQKYLFTYLTATSFYELIVKWIIDKVNTYFKINK
jgi:hypothetical protein